jgi:hypothetical protein
VRLLELGPGLLELGGALQALVQQFADQLVQPSEAAIGRLEAGILWLLHVSSGHAL